MTPRKLPPPDLSRSPALLTPRQACAVLQVSRKTLFTYIASGRLPAHRLSARAIRIDASELARLGAGPEGGVA